MVATDNSSQAAVRQRRWHLNDNEDYSSGARFSQGQKAKNCHNTRNESIDRTFTHCILTVAFLLLTIFGLTFAFPDLIPLSALMNSWLSSGSFEYAVVLDAGSTGSRVLGFTFQRIPDTNSLELKDELWMQVKPGLSSYADNPKAARDGLLQLLEAAKGRVPTAYRPHTPVTLKATAGLRMLPKEKSEAILTEVRQVLEQSGFKPEDNLIEIMNPLDEGLFGWFTVNFLLRQFESKDLDASHVSLDLGGGSTQITFAPSKPVSGIDGRKHFKHNVTVMGRNFNVYSHSYLGLGLQAARKAILALENPDLDDEEGRSKVVTSSCMTTATPKKWAFQGQEYTITKGDEESSSSSSRSAFDRCRLTVTKILSDIHRPSELSQRRIAAFSYFFDLAQEHGLIPEDQFDKEIKVGDYKSIAMESCGPKGTGFNCFDLTFIYQMLAEGYGLQDEKNIHLYKKIAGHEASWALGLAYNILQ